MHEKPLIDIVPYSTGNPEVNSCPELNPWQADDPLSWFLWNDGPMESIGFKKPRKQDTKKNTEIQFTSHENEISLAMLYLPVIQSLGTCLWWATYLCPCLCQTSIPDKQAYQQMTWQTTTHTHGAPNKPTDRTRLDHKIWEEEERWRNVNAKMNSKMEWALKIINILDR